MLPYHSRPVVGEDRRRVRCCYVLNHSPCAITYELVTLSGVEDDQSRSRQTGKEVRLSSSVEISSRVVSASGKACGEYYRQQCALRVAVVTIRRSEAGS